MSRNKGFFPVSNATGPSFSLIPYSITMLLAMDVARSRSFCAPVEISLKIISSATLPPRSTASLSNNSALVRRYLSSVGSCSV